MPWVERIELLRAEAEQVPGSDGRTVSSKDGEYGAFLWRFDAEAS